MGTAPHEQETRALKMAVALYVVVFAFKLAVYFATGVMALLAEALHTVSDVFISAFLLVATIWSQKKADAVHMFGYGRAQNVAALVAATLFISFTSYKLYEEAIPRLFRAEEASYQNLPLAMGVLVVSMLIAAAPLAGLLREKKRGAAAKAQVIELVQDELGLVAALAGTMLVSRGWALGDPLASIVVATIIAITAIALFRDNLSFLLGRSPGPAYLAEVERLARSVPGVLGVHDLRAEYIGPEAVHAGLHIEVQPGTPIEEAARIAKEVEQRVHHGLNAGYCVIHVDPVGAPR